MKKVLKLAWVVKVKSFRNLSLPRGLEVDYIYFGVKEAMQWRLRGFATKVGIGGGVVYFTVDQGVWGDSRQAAATYDRLYDIMPGTKNVSLKYLTLPKTDDVNINFRSYWNSGVFFVFDFLANLPSKMIGLKDSAVGLVSSATSSKSDESTPTTEESNPAVESETSVTETSAAPESTPPLEEKAE